MKKTIVLLALSASFQCGIYAQSDQHYTMFMFNKLQFNPAYAGSRDVAAFNATYRNQWVGLDGAPKTMNVSGDGLLGKYEGSHRNHAIGGTIINEQIGIESNTSVMGYYAFRFPIKKTMMSLGLRAGTKMYTANYSQLDPYQQIDIDIDKDVRNAFLPNAGTGAYWSGENFYLGASIPNLIENYYDKQRAKTNNISAREIRAYYVMGGYTFNLGSMFQLQPQVFTRYAKNSRYSLPLNCDFNLSAIYDHRLLLGVTYRTDNSYEGIIQLQTGFHMNIGYAYDYALSSLSQYVGGSHEIVIGYDIYRAKPKYASPRFIKNF